MPPTTGTDAAKKKQEAERQRKQEAERQKQEAERKKQEALRQKEEDERKAVEKLKNTVKERLLQMRTEAPGDAATSAKWLTTTATDKRLSPEFKTWMTKQGRIAECAANMRATDKALQEAVRLAQLEKLKERSAMVNLGRTYFAKATSLGADEEFRAATNRLIDTAMLSGGIYIPGKATRAKPADVAPKNPKTAKS